MQASATQTASRNRMLQLRRRPDLVVVEQRYGHQRYWVLKDPVAWRYARLSEQEYAIWQQLDGSTSLENIQQNFERRFVPMKLSLPQLQGFLGTLHQRGLVLADAWGQGDQLVQRDNKQRSRERLHSIIGILAIRFRGINPDPILDWLYPWVRPLFHPAAVMCSLLLMLAALVLIAVQFETLQSRLPGAASFFQTSNLIWIGIALGATKILHEFGHGLTCKHFGARCHELGVMFLVFAPCLYCNVSDSWTLPNKWHRMAVTAAGIWVELSLAAVCTFVWWFSEPGLLNTLCLNTMFVCSVSTVLFNGNPLLRYDGYYILADWLESPNLWQQSRGYLRSLFRRIVLGLRLHEDLSWRTERRGWLLLYGLLSIAYRWFVLAAILLFLFRFFRPLRMEAIAQVLAVIVLAGLIVEPIRLGWHVMKNSTKRREAHWGRFLLLLGGLTLAAAFAAFIPVPFRLSAPIVIQPVGAERVYVAVRGELREIHVQPGDLVQAGQLLARLQNLQLRREVVQLEGDLQEQRIHLESLQARRASDPDAARQIPATRETLQDIQRQLDRRREEFDKLTLRATQSGTVIPPPIVPPESAEMGVLPRWSATPLEPKNLGCTLEAGDLFCIVGDPAQLEAVVYLDQADVEFVEVGQPVRVRVDTLSGVVLKGKLAELARMETKIAPRELTERDLAISEGSDGVVRPLNASFQARVLLEDHNYQIAIGSRGRAKIEVESISLSRRLYRKLSQTFNFDL